MQLDALRALRVAILGSALVLSANFGLAADEPVAECAPCKGAIRVDGNLEEGEWDRSAGLTIGEGQVVRRGPGYAGSSDLAGRIYACRSATTLYLAGEIDDDTLFWNPQVSWLGDGVEVFLDFHPDPSARPPDGDRYDEFVHQLLLHPLAGEVKWRFAQFRGRPGRPDDPVDGLELAGLPRRDAKGATVGYTFELALPLANFPAAKNEEGATFGFDIALSDSDGLPEQKNYATWSGRGQLSSFPSRFGRMRVGKAPPPIAPPQLRAFSPILPLAFLVAGLSALLFLWLARGLTPRHPRLGRVLGRLRAIPLRTKLVAAGVLVVLVVLAGWVGDLLGAGLAARAVAEKRELAVRLAELAAETSRVGLLDPQPPLHPAPLVSLLAGQTVEPPVEYDYTVVPPVAEEPHRTADGVPFFRRDIPASAAWSGSFVVHPPVQAEAATLVYSWRPEPGREPPAPDEVVAEFRFVHRDGKVDAPALRWGREVDAADDPAAGAAAHPGAPDARIAFLSGHETEGARKLHGDALTVRLPSSASPVDRVEIEQRSTAGSLVIHGVTLRRAGAGENVPLPLGRVTRGGVPTAASPFPEPWTGLQLHREMEDPFRRASVDCDVRADRLWIVASLRRGYRDVRYRAPVLLVEAVFDDGSVDGPFRLENGVNVDAESTPARQHGEGYGADLAFEWGLPGQPRRHFDVIPLQLERTGRRLTQVQFEFRGEDEIVRIASITAGAQAARAQPTALQWLEATAEGYRLPAQDLERLADLDFTVYRDGTAVATTATGSLRDRMLARTLTSQQAARVTKDPAGVHDVRLLDGEKLHTLAIPVSGAARATTVLELAWSSDAEDSVESVVTALRIALSILLAPLLVLVVADLVLLVPSLHVRLVAAFAAAALVPVVLGGFAVPVLLGGKIEGAQRETVLEKSGAVKGRLATLRSLARQRAEAALRDDALQEALRRRGSPEFQGAVAAALRDLQRTIGEDAGGEARVSLEVQPLSSASEPVVFPPETRWTVFSERTPTLSDELAYRSSRLFASGVAQQYDTAGDWLTTLVVELPLQRPALSDAAAAAGGNVEVMLYTPRGFPLATTGIQPQGEDTPEELARKQGLIQQVLGEQRPVIETRTLGGQLHTVGYDVLRGDAGVVSLVGTAVPRSATEDLLNRVGAVSLLVFGAGVAMQFLLVGSVVGATADPFRRLLERARLLVPAGTAAPREEIATLEHSLAAVQADREVYRSELGRLHDAVVELAGAHDPDAVVERAIAILRSSVTPWGALLVAQDADGKVELLGGYRKGERLERAPLALDESGQLLAAVRGKSETRAHVTDASALGRDEARLLGGAASFEAFPLGAEGERGGALVLLHRPGETVRAFHAEFLAALAKHVGLALASARLLRLAVHDSDTGAYVQSFFAERLREEVDRAVSGKRPIALLLARISDLPADPAAARRAVHRLAETIRTLAPARAFTGRVDDATIGVAVPEADRHAAEALARELRRAATETGLAELRVRVGFAACPEDAGSYEFLRAEARRHLLEDRETAAPEATAAVDDRARLVADARRLGVVFESGKGVQILETIERIAVSDITILVEGETGVGKEIVADLIHRKSVRRDRPLVKVNCAALPDALLESELFGYERGAFTGADRSKPGRFELADGGTIFLDEIGDMPLATQVKLLRVLEDRAVEHLGGTRPTPIDVRVIAATNRDLRAAMAHGRFREDLYYRLNAVTISVPPLRARKEDIPALAEVFVRAAAEAHGRRPPTIAPDAMDLLYRHDWPGNVRELRNAIEQAVVLSSSETIRAGDLSPVFAVAAPARARTASGPWRSDPHRTDSAPPAISDRQRRLLALLSERAWVTNTDYCEAVGISTRTGLRDIQELVERGVIVMEGKRRGARYRLP